MYTSLNTELDKGEKAFKRIKEQISTFPTRTPSRNLRILTDIHAHSSILDPAEQGARFDQRAERTGSRALSARPDALVTTLSFAGLSPFLLSYLSVVDHVYFTTE